MNYYEDSLKVCREFLSRNPHVDKVFEKQGKGTGFLYEYEQEERRLLSEITVKPAESFVILRMESGIRADADALGITIQACQLCSSPDEPGILMISPDNRYITYLISSPIVELPVCEETLAWMHACAFGKITACESFLKMLSRNRLDPKLLAAMPKRKEDLLPEGLKETLQFVVEVLKADFAETDGAAVNMLQSREDPVLFFNEIRTKDGIFYEKISVDPSGCLIVYVRPAVQIDRLEQGDLAPVCNRLNCEQARNGLLSGLHAFSDDGFLCFSSPISLWDGLIGIEAVKAIENYALRHLEKCMSELRKKYPEDEDPITEIIKKYQMDEDEDEGEDEDPRPMIIFEPFGDESQEGTSKPDILPETETEPIPPALMLTQVGTACWRWTSEDSEDTLELELDPALYSEISGTKETVDPKGKRTGSDGIDPKPGKPNSLDEAMQKHREFKKRLQQLEERLKRETDPVTDGG